MRNHSALIKLSLGFGIAALSSALLSGCGDGADMTNENVSGEVGQAVEETRDAAGNAADETGEAMERTGDRVESATD